MPDDVTKKVPTREEAAAKLREAVGFLRWCLRSGEWRGADHPVVLDAISAYDAAEGENAAAGEADAEGRRA